MNEARVLPERWRLEQGEALRLLRDMPDASVDAVITDPPYSSGGAFRGDRTGSTTTKYVNSDVKLERPDFSGDTRDQRSFGYWSALWLSECLRVAKPGAPICVFTDWRQLPTTTDAVQAGGWIWRGLVAWDKTEGARPSMGRFSSQCEYVVWGSNGPMPNDRGVGCLPGFVRAYPNPSEEHHIAGKPLEVMMALVRVCEPGGLILDPFAGSASTGVAAMRLGYRFVGFELTDAYTAIARERLAAEEREQPVEGLRGGQEALFR